MTTPTHAARESADLGHDGLVHWKPFKEYAESVHWNLANFSPNEIDEYYGLFLAGYAAAQASGWHKISEDGLPDRPGIYYVTLHDGTFNLSAFYVGAFDKDVIAYLPYPPPFTPDGEGSDK